MIRIFIILIFHFNLLSIAYPQSSCENNCGSGTLQEYWDDEIDCVCNMNCAGYGSACCDFYDECFDNPSNLQFNDFIGTWSGNITNDQTWAFDDLISFTIESNGQYTITNNPGGHLVSDLYPGTEEVYYNSLTNILTFQWVQYYHYACGGACYSGSSFQVMEHNNGEMILFYNNGSGPAPQANSLFLSLDEYECLDGEVNNENPCNPMECFKGEWFEIIIDCAEGMGIPCDDGIYISPPDGVCCSECILLGDLNQDLNININDVVLLINIVLGISIYDELADLNQDANIDVLDVVHIVNIILD